MNPTRADIETTIKTIESLLELFPKQKAACMADLYNGAEKVRAWLELNGDELAIDSGHCPDYTPKEPERPKSVKTLTIQTMPVAELKEHLEREHKEIMETTRRVLEKLS